VTWACCTQCWMPCCSRDIGSLGSPGLGAWYAHRSCTSLRGEIKNVCVPMCGRMCACVCVWAFVLASASMPPCICAKGNSFQHLLLCSKCCVGHESQCPCLSIRIRMIPSPRWFCASKLECISTSCWVPDPSQDAFPWHTPCTPHAHPMHTPNTPRAASLHNPCTPRAASLPAARLGSPLFRTCSASNRKVPKHPDLLALQQNKRSRAQAAAFWATP